MESLVPSLVDRLSSSRMCLTCMDRSKMATMISEHDEDQQLLSYVDLFIKSNPSEFYVNMVKMFLSYVLLNDIKCSLTSRILIVNAKGCLKEFFGLRLYSDKGLSELLSFAVFYKVQVFLITEPGIKDYTFVDGCQIYNSVDGEFCEKKVIWAQIPGIPTSMRWPVKVVDLPLVYCNCDNAWLRLKGKFSEAFPNSMDKWKSAAEKALKRKPATLASFKEDVKWALEIISQDIVDKDGNKSDGHQEADSNKSDGHQDVDGNKLDGHQEVDGNKSDGYQEVDGNKSDGHQDVDGNKSDGHQDVDGNKLDGHQETDGNKSDGYQEVDGNKSDGHQDVDGNKLDGHQETDGNKSDGYQEVDGNKSEGHQEADGNKSDGHQEADGNKSDGYQEVDGNKSEGHQEADGNKSDGHQEADSNKSDGHQEADGNKSDGHQEADGNKSDGHQEVDGNKLDGHQEADGNKSDGHQEADGNKSDGHQEVDGKKSDGHQEADGNKSDGHQEADGNKSDGHQEVDGNKSDGHQEADGNKSDGHQEVDGNKSEGHQEADGNKSDGHQEVDGKKSDGHQEADGNKSDGHQEADGNKSDGHQEVDGNKSDGHQEADGKKSDGHQEVDGNKSDSSHINPKRLRPITKRKKIVVSDSDDSDGPYVKHVNQDGHNLDGSQFKTKCQRPIKRKKNIASDSESHLTNVNHNNNKFPQSSNLKLKKNIILSDSEGSDDHYLVESNQAEFFTARRRKNCIVSDTEDSDEEMNLKRKCTVIISDSESSHDSGRSDLFPLLSGKTEKPSIKPDFDDSDCSEDDNPKVLDYKNKEIYVSCAEKSLFTKDGKRKKTDRKYNARHMCPFCQVKQTNFSHHIMSKKHQEEEVVKKIKGTKDGVERKRLIDQLRLRSDHENNISVIKKKKGEIFLLRRLNVEGSDESNDDSDEDDKKFQVSNYGPCPNCFGWVLKKSLRRHFSTCTSSKSTECNWTNRALEVQSDIIAGNIPSEASQALVKEVYPIMKGDEVSKIAKADDLIVNLGNQWLRRNRGNEIMRKYYTSTVMRLAAKLKIGCQRLSKTELDMSSFLTPKFFETVLRAAISCCHVNEEDEEELKAPSNAIKLGFDIKRMLSAKLSKAIIAEDEKGQKDAVDFKSLMEIEWGLRVTKLARSLLVERSYSKRNDLPRPSDVKNLFQYLKEELAKLDLKDNTYTTYRRAVTLTLARLTLYNRRRCHEVQAMRLKSYSARTTGVDEIGLEIRKELTEFERVLLTTQEVVVIRGKTGKGVPVILPGDVKEAMTYITSANIRSKAGIPEENKYVFGSKGVGVFRAYDAIREVAESPEAGLEMPDLVRTSNMRKYMATMLQALDTTEAERQWVLDHLGHTLNVHRTHYRQTSDVLERIDVAKILLIQDFGLVSKYRGKKLQDIQIEGDIETCQKVFTVHGGKHKKGQGHSGHVMCLAISSDGKYLASGDTNKEIHIRNPDTMERIKVFTGHRNTVSGLAFRKGTHQLFSASHDRAVKIWNCDEMAYVETLYGHEDTITCIDSLTRERAITSGGRDGSVRIWKVIEESQLVFHGHTGSIDCVSLINESNFVSGADDNSIALWGVMKKKPLCLVRNAHSGDSNDNIVSNTENWISSVVSLQHTDLLASGSKDGQIRFWKCGDDFKSLKPIFNLPVVGFVNCLQFSKDGNFLVAGVGQEHKMGRWWRIKEAKNSICIIKLKKKSET